MLNFLECLICRNPSQTDIDGKGNGKKKMKGSNVVQSQLRSVFLLQKLLEVSSSTCIDLLKNSHGSNPSSWFSCCWSCYTIVREAEKISNALTKLEKQLENLKTAMQTKLWENYDDKLKKSKSTVLNEKKNENIVNIIRGEAVKRIGLYNANIRTVSQVTREERLNVENKVKIEIDEEILDTENFSDFPADDNHESNAIRDLQAVSRINKRITSKSNKVNIPRRTRSGRLIKSRLPPHDKASDSSSEDRQDSGDNNISGDEKDNYNQENSSTEKTKTKSLRKRIIAQHSQMKGFKCKHCDEKFRNNRLRHTHEMNVHKNLYKFRCNLCLKKYLTFQYLKAHLRRFHKEKINPAPSCTLKLKSYKSRSGDENDESDNNLPNGERDNDCKEEKIETELNNTESPQSSLRMMSKAGNKHFKIAKDFKGYFKCKHCEKSFRTQRLRHKHETQVHGNLYTFQCDHCLKKYLKLEYLHLHLRRCHNGKVYADPSCTVMLKKLAPRGSIKWNDPHKCEECDKEFNTRQRLNDHMTCVHRKERNFVCEICSESFLYIRDLKLHQLCKHGDSEEQKSIQCKECGKILGHPLTLTKHINIVHKKEFPFRCSICNVGKIYQSALDLHIVQAHTEGPKPHACTMCEKSYGRKGMLDIHMRTHTGERPFKCSFCDSRFFSKPRQVRHERSLHVKEKRFQCEQCGSRFPSQHYLNSHVYSTHNKKVSSIEPKKLMDKQELVKYVESANQHLKKRNETTKWKKNTTNIYKLHIEEQLKQNELLNNSSKEDGNEFQPETTET